MITFLGDVALLSKHLISKYEIDGDFIPNVEYVIDTTGNKLIPVEGKINLASSYSNFQQVFGKNPVAVCLANNHMLDYGEKGYQSTKHCLENKGIEVIGEGAYWYNEKVSILAYTCISGICDGISYFNFDKSIVRKQIDDVKKYGANTIIVIMHWGIENSYTPSASQKEIGRWLIDNGVDIVIGNHPHCIQPIEVYKNKTIVYSLGNCIFPSFSVSSHFDDKGIPQRKYRFNWRSWNNKGLAIIFNEKKKQIERIDIIKFQNNTLKCFKRGISIKSLSPKSPSWFYSIQFFFRKYWLFFVSNFCVEGHIFDINAIKQELKKQ